MSDTPSIVIGKEGFGIKNGNLLGYYRADDGIYVARQFTSTRGGGTNGTFVNSSGLIEVAASPNLPRIDFSSGSKAVLIEPSAQNLLLRSEEFDDGYWTKNNATISANATAAPDGATTADKIVAASGTVNANVARQNITITAAAQTISVFLKQGEFTWSRVRVYDRRDSTGYSLFINLATGELGAIPAGTTAAISIAANGFYRVQFSIPATAVLFSTECDVYIGPASSDGVVEVSGDGVKGIFAWGVQLETGAVATSYIPTTTGTITRNADVITLANASEYIGQTEGTLYAEVDLRQNSLISIQLITLWTTAPNRLQIFIDGNRKIVFQAVLNGSVVFQFTPNDVLANGVYKIALGYQSGDSVLYVNGVSISQSTTTYTVPPCSNINLGSNAGSTAQLNDRLRAAAIYTTRLSDAQLIDMTWQ